MKGPVDRYRGVKASALLDRERERFSVDEGLAYSLAERESAERMLINLKEAMASRWFHGPGPRWLPQALAELQAGRLSGLDRLRCGNLVKAIQICEKRGGNFIGPIQFKTRPMKPSTVRWIANAEAFDAMTAARPLKPPKRQ